MESKPLLSAWEPPLACLAWKMLITDGREVNKKGACLKIIIYLCFKNLSSGTSANHCFPLRRDYLFTFMFCHHLLKQAAETEKSTVVIIYALCVANVGCIMTGSFLPWITMFSRCLNFGGALHLCFAVSERASEIPLLSYCIMVVLTMCCCLRYPIIAL